MKKIFLTMLLLLIFIVSCGSKNAEGTKKSGDIIKIAVNLQSEPKSLDPQLASDASGITIDSLIYEGLTRLDQEGKVVPAAAESWEISEDGLKWIFHLRKDMK